jgi:dCMP deaminase
MSYLSQITELTNTWKERPKWDEYFMMCAQLLSSRSSCERLRVGCIVVKDNIIICSGYNGHVVGAEHISIIVDGHEQATIHAEHNAIANASKRGANTSNTTVYITHYPCLNCAKLLVQAGIKKIIYHTDYRNNPLVEKILTSANVLICKFPDIKV